MCIKKIFSSAYDFNCWTELTTSNKGNRIPYVFAQKLMKPIKAKRLYQWYVILNYVIFVHISSGWVIVYT